MVRSRTLLALIVGGIVSLVLAPGALSSDFRGQVQLSGQEAALLRSVNEARARSGSPPLRIAAPLQRAARSHSNAMLRTGYFTHGDWYRRLRRHGARSRALGETLAWGVGAQGSADGIVEMWLASPPHRVTMLRRSFRFVGVGIASGAFAGFDGASVATANFGGP